MGDINTMRGTAQNYWGDVSGQFDQFCVDNKTFLFLAKQICLDRDHCDPTFVEGNPDHTKVTHSINEQWQDATHRASLQRWCCTTPLWGSINTDNTPQQMIFECETPHLDPANTSLYN